MVVLLCSSKERLISSIQRRIECGGHAGCGTGKDQSFFKIVLGKAGKTAQFVHDGRTDLHRRAFPAHSRSAHQPKDSKQDFPDRHAQRKHLFANLAAFFRVERSNDLRDAAALGAREIFSGDIDDQRKAGRGDQQRQIRRNGKHLVEHAVRPL